MVTGKILSPVGGVHINLSSRCAVPWLCEINKEKKEWKKESGIIN
jgi:hypothetical protein